MPYTTKQSLNAKKGEVRYRSARVLQLLGETNSINNEPDVYEFRKLLKSKLKITENKFKRFQKKSIHLSPYLEIGSEHGLRAALLDDKFKAKGFAIDISLHSLAKASAFSKFYGYKKAPKTICADAENLPFASESFPFVFVYETLHHFPYLKSPLEEAYRVLSPGGVCFIGSDPVKQTFQFSLWYRPNKLRAWEKVLKALFILPFISHIGKTEVEEGIIEGAFSLKEWEEALSIFDKVEVTLKTFPLGPSQTIIKNDHKKWLTPNLQTRLALFLFGGGLEAICFKKGDIKITDTQINNYLICPNCKHTRKIEIRITNYQCPKCRSTFSKKLGVPILIEKKLAEELFNIN